MVEMDKLEEKKNKTYKMKTKMMWKKLLGSRMNLIFTWGVMTSEENQLQKKWTNQEVVRLTSAD